MCVTVLLPPSAPSLTWIWFTGVDADFPTDEDVPFPILKQRKRPAQRVKYPLPPWFQWKTTFNTRIPNTQSGKKLHHHQIPDHKVPVY